MDVKFDFSGKNFLVVGASSGMGREIAKELAAAGAHVLAVARNMERLCELRDENSERIDVAVKDVTVSTVADWDELLASYVEKHGKLSGMVYTAGTSYATPLRFFDYDRAREVMETGFWGAVKVLQSCTKKRYVHKGSSYVVFSSTAANAAEKGLAVYAAAKSAVVVGMKSFAHDLAKDGHRINTISPGYVDTGMTQNARTDMGDPVGVIERHLFGIGKPENVAGMVLFLMSNCSSWITGANFIVDGGYLLGGNKA